VGQEPVDRRLLAQLEILIAQGQWHAAGALCDELMTHERSSAALWTYRGIVCLNGNRFGEAEEAFRNSVCLNPENASAWHHLSLILLQDKRAVEAEACSRRAVSLDATPAIFWLQLGNVLFAQEQFANAASAYQNSVTINPLKATAWKNYGSSQHVQKNWTEARRAYESSLALEPSQFDTRVKLADVLERMHVFSAAERVAQGLADDFPDVPDVWSLLGRIQLALAKHDSAIRALRKAVDKHDSASKHSRLLQALQYQVGAEPSALLDEHREWARIYADGTLLNAPRGKVTDRLRLGFVSADLGQNPVAHMVLPVLEALDKRHCSITCYFDSRVEDSITPRFRLAADRWRAVFGLPDATVAEQIRQDKIDIVVDLMGHAGNRLLVFAHKPARIQLTWFGYVGTTGMQAMDYLLADHFHVQPGEEGHYVEKVLRMPHGYACYRGPEDAPDVSALPAIAAGRITFGCFNNPAKWSSRTLDAWSTILHRVPTAGLFLKYYGLHDPQTQDHFRHEFQSRGVNAERVIMEGWSPHRDLLLAYQRVDIGLDTQPYSGGVTTCEALWMGVPVITFPGKTFAGRHAFSHLTNAGFSQFVATDAESYVDTAVDWAGRLEELAELRLKMRETMQSSPLCDAHRFARDFLTLMNEVC
jgi:protein O-GlcNAc transferase